MAHTVPNHALGLMLTRLVAGKTLKMLLVDATSDLDENDDYPADAGTLGEITASGYSRQTLTNVGITVDDVNNRAELDCDPVTFSSVASGDTVTKAVIIEFVTDDSDSPVLAIIDVTDRATNGSDLVFTPGADGFLHASQA